MPTLEAQAKVETLPNRQADDGINDGHHAREPASVTQRVGRELADDEARAVLAERRALWLLSLCG